MGSRLFAKYKVLFFERYREPLFYFDFKKTPPKALAKKERFFLIVLDKEKNRRHMIIYHIKRDLKSNKVLLVDRFFRCADKWEVKRKYYKQTGKNYQIIKI